MFPKRGLVKNGTFDKSGESENKTEKEKKFFRD